MELEQIRDDIEHIPLTTRYAQQIVAGYWGLDIKDSTTLLGEVLGRDVGMLSRLYRACSYKIRIHQDAYF